MFAFRQLCAPPRAIELAVLVLVLLAAPALLVQAAGAQTAAAAAAASSDASQEGTVESQETMEDKVAAATAAALGEDAVVENEEDYEWFPAHRPDMRYRIEALPKVEGAYRYYGENQVRLPRGVVLELADEDEELLYVKIYDWIKKPERATRVPVSVGVSPEEMDAARERNKVELETVDRLQLESFDRGLPRRGQWRNEFGLGDLNGDGHLDIVFSARRKGPPVPQVFLHDGEGSWRSWREAQWAEGQPYDYGAAATGDFNGDGNVDVAFGIHLSGMMALVQDGDARFEPWSEGIEVDFPGRGGDATSFSSRSVRVLDWNKDGRLDILALGEGPKGMKTRKSRDPRSKDFGELIDTARGFVLYLNQGDGTWQATRPAGAAASDDFGDDFAVADLNGDGRLDLVSATSRLGNNRVLQVSGEGDLLSTRALLPVRPAGVMGSVDAADLDGDGHQDLVFGYRSTESDVWFSGIDVLFGDGAFNWQRLPLHSEETKGGIGALEIADLDGDGRPDVAGLGGDGEVLIFLNEGERRFAREITEEAPAQREGCRGFDLQAADLDGREGLELVAAFAGEQTGYPGLKDLSKPGCVGEGSLRVWKIATPNS
ncbi:MAG: VCBS repeat-containing protein [Acidobacteriota bacterium]